MRSTKYERHFYAEEIESLAKRIIAGATEDDEADAAALLRDAAKLLLDLDERDDETDRDPDELRDRRLFGNA